MADYQVYASEQELREALDDVNDLLADFKQPQRQIDEERSILAERVQGVLAETEKKVSDYERGRADLDRREAELQQQRQPFLEARERLQQQLDAKQEAKLGHDPGASAGKPADPAQPKPDVTPPKPVTKADVDKLKSQLTKPQPELKLNPPGGISQTSAIDRDLKLLATAREKQAKLDGASQNLRENWERSAKPKR